MGSELQHPIRKILFVDFPPDETDISDGLTINVQSVEEIDVGTFLVPRMDWTQRHCLQILAREQEDTWIGRWRDRAEMSPYNGHLFRLELMETCQGESDSTGTFRVEFLVWHDFEESATSITTSG